MTGIKLHIMWSWATINYKNFVLKIFDNIGGEIPIHMHVNLFSSLGLTMKKFYSENLPISDTVQLTARSPGTREHSESTCEYDHCACEDPPVHSQVWGGGRAWRVECAWHDTCEYRVCAHQVTFLILRVHRRDVATRYLKPVTKVKKTKCRMGRLSVETRSKVIYSDMEKRIPGECYPWETYAESCHFQLATVCLDQEVSYD